MVARAGLTLYRVVTVKRAGRLHVAVDGGMGDNLEHSLYGQRFSPLVVGRWDGEPVVADLVGRHCESGDVITPDVRLVSPSVGDLVVDRKSTRLNSSHMSISYAVFCLNK